MVPQGIRSQASLVRLLGNSTLAVPFLYTPLTKDGDDVPSGAFWGATIIEDRARANQLRTRRTSFGTAHGVRYIGRSVRCVADN